MKHAFLITAYKDIPSLNRLIDRLSSDFYLYIHIDKKSSIRKSDIQTNKHVFIYRRYSINWGSFNHLQAVLFLLKKSLKIEPDYVHVITAQDYLCVTNQAFDEFFSTRKGKSFMDYVKASENWWYVVRYKYYWFTDVIVHPKSFDFFSHPVIRRILKSQKRFKVNRSHLGRFNDDYIYKGLVYVSLYKDAVKEVLNYLKKDSGFLRSLRYCLIPEEFFFQTILLNSPLKNSIENENLRYMDWGFRNGISPCVLDESDYNAIVESGKLIIRKVSDSSRVLLEMLEGREQNGNS